MGLISTGSKCTCSSVSTKILTSHRYPVGHGAAWTPQNNLAPKPEEAALFGTFLQALRQKLGSTKLISVALPGTPEDAIAYTAESMPAIDAHVNFYNLMTYDLVNRHSAKSGYASGKKGIQKGVDYYKEFMDPMKLNVGFGLYAKWFRLTSAQTCSASAAIGCDMGPFEAPDGTANTQSGTWRMSPITQNLQYPNLFPNNPDGQHGTDLTLQASYQAATAATGTSSEEDGASATYDATNKLFWTWLSPADVTNTCSSLKGTVGGMMLWSLNMDENTQAGGPHIKALADCMAA
jgi:GH18 family chitinase